MVTALHKWGLRQARKWGPKREPSTAAGERIYAIGDVHGCLELLLDLLDRIETHSASLPRPATEYIVMLGDMVDRGPLSAQVLRFAQQRQQEDAGFIVLQGNHEEIMLRALDGDEEMLDAWMQHGGLETLRSFGVTLEKSDTNLAAFLRETAQLIPKDLITWIRTLPASTQSGDYFFCHAGIRPGLTLSKQSRGDLLWIRNEFLRDESDHGAVVVHGHSIVNSVEILPNRIGLDTGAYATGNLSALYLEGTARALISTVAPSIDA